MSILIRRVARMIVASLLVAWPIAAQDAANDGPRNIILMIGDGMGDKHIEAASLYAHGRPGQLSLESLPEQGLMTTGAADDAVTDSAASATAMATGKRVNNGVISLAIPGSGRKLETVLEHFADRCKSTGLVTTSEITHATPAAFAAHVDDRYKGEEIARDYMEQTRPDILLGGGADELTSAMASRAGYTVARNIDELAAAISNQEDKIFGRFGSGYMPFEWDINASRLIRNRYDTLPGLSAMTEVALASLERNPSGFFLMVESGQIDAVSHAHQLQRAVFEVLEFDRSVQIVKDWAAANPETLIIVTSDHETGGLAIEKNNGQGALPAVTWSSGNHTAAPVPVLAWGPNAEMIDGNIDVTDIHEIMTSGSGKAACASGLSRILSTKPPLMLYGFVVTMVMIVGVLVVSLVRRFRTGPQQIM